MKRLIRDCVLFIIFFFMFAALVGCAKHTPVSETIADNALNTATGLEQSLPAECKTESIITQIATIKMQIRAVTNACNTEKDAITQEKLKYQWGFYGILVVIGVFLARKVLK